MIGIEATDLMTQNTIQILAKKVVNAAGPWVDDVRAIEGQTNGKHLILSKGVHIVFDQSKFPLQQAIYFDTPDGRMVFAIPRNGKTYVGTTDTFYKGDPRDMNIEQSDRDYIMNAIHYMFPTVGVKDADIESSWAGVRPLIHEEGKGPSEISRHDEVWESAAGLVTIAGGKLTGYRKMAEAVVNRIAASLQSEFGIVSNPCFTKNLPISGGEVGGSQHLQTFIEEKAKLGVKEGLTKEEASYLAQHYGSNVEKVYRYVAQANETMPAALFAQLQYGIEHELVASPVDFFVRRTGNMFFNIASVKAHKDAVVEHMAQQLGWSSEQIALFTEQLNIEITRATTAK